MYNSTMYINTEIFVLVLKYFIIRPKEFKNYFLKSVKFTIGDSFSVDIFNYNLLISKNYSLQNIKKFDIFRDIFFIV
jgi:hypothetical protein